MIRLYASTKIGMSQPNVLMLLAIARICCRECLLGLLGSKRRLASGTCSRRTSPTTLLRKRRTFRRGFGSRLGSLGVQEDGAATSSFAESLGAGARLDARLRPDGFDRVELDLSPGPVNALGKATSPASGLAPALAKSIPSPIRNDRCFCRLSTIASGTRDRSRHGSFEAQAYGSRNETKSVVRDDLGLVGDNSLYFFLQLEREVCPEATSLNFQTFLCLRADHFQNFIDARIGCSLHRLLEATSPNGQRLTLRGASAASGEHPEPFRNLRDFGPVRRRIHFPKMPPHLHDHKRHNHLRRGSHRRSHWSAPPVQSTGLANQVRRAKGGLRKREGRSIPALQRLLCRRVSK